MKSELIFQSSPWFLVLCIAIGLAYTFVLYQKSKGLSKIQQIVLSFLRGILVTILTFLLLNPLLKSIKSIVIKPTTVIAIDNSTSMLAMGKAGVEKVVSELKNQVENIQSKGFEVEFRVLDEANSQLTDLNQLKFNQKKSNLSKLLSDIKNDYEGRNLSNVVLLSDGIVNSGISPSSTKYDFKIHTIGFGDTTKRRDLKLLAIYANKIAYMGNKFPVQAEISSFGLAGKSTMVVLKKGEQVIDKQPLSIGKNEEIKQVTFNIEANQKGVQRFIVEVIPVVGEATTKNNRREVFVDVVDGKEKILMVGLTPHPDMKALKAILDKNDLYELEVRNLQSDNLNEIGSKPFDILILHQMPDILGQSGNIITRLLSQVKPTLFVLGNQTNISSFNGMQQALAISTRGSKADKVTTQLNKDFKLFNLDNPNVNEVLEKLPPINVPFGDYKTLAGTETILFQRVGTLVTPRPLLMVNTTVPRKTAILAGEGLWQWRMDEFEQTENNIVLDDILLKAIQLISVKDDKRKLRVYPIAPEFSIDDKVVFETELYNTIYERIYDKPITLILTDEKGVTKSYNYTVSKDNSRFEISSLAAGAYRYKATSTVLGKTEEASGQFVVSDMDLESINTTANFDLLRTLSQQNDGKFVLSAQIANIFSDLEKFKNDDKVVSEESMDEIINLRWLLFLLLLLASLEWGIRKYLGTY